MNPKSFAAVGLVVSTVFIGHFAQGAVDRTVPVPSIVSTDAIAWFDAADFSTITADGNGVVSEWKDKSEKGEHTAVTGILSGFTGPIYSQGSGCPYLDFGQLRSKQDLSYDRMTNIRTVFFVGWFQSHADVFLLGDKSNVYFHRGDNGCYFSSRWSDDKTAKVWNGDDMVDGYSVALPDDSVQFIVCEMSNDSASDRFTEDRNKNRNGGRQLYEVIMFDKVLADAERKSVMTYLKTKWNFKMTVGSLYSSSEANRIDCKKVTLEFDAGGTLVIDEPPAHDFDIECAGALNLVSAPGYTVTAADLDRLHCQGVKGRLSHDWYRFNGRRLLAVNFNSGKGAEAASDASRALDVDMGGNAWKNVTEGTQSTPQDVSVYDTIRQRFVDDMAKVTWTSYGTYSGSSCPTAPFLQGYLDDWSGGAHVTVTDIPFDVYDVVVYSRNGDSAAVLPVSVNGILYTCGEDGIGHACGDGEPADYSWGDNSTTRPEWGKSAMLIEKQTGDLLVAGTEGLSDHSKRGPICAVMIIERPRDVIRLTDVAKMSDVVAAIPPGFGSCDVELSFSDGASFDVDAILPADVDALRVSCAGMLRFTGTGSATIQLPPEWTQSVETIDTRMMIPESGLTLILCDVNGTSLGDRVVVSEGHVYIKNADGTETLYWDGSAGWTNVLGLVTEVTDKTSLVLQNGDDVTLAEAIAPAVLQVRFGATARLRGYDKLGTTPVNIPQNSTLEFVESNALGANFTGTGTLCFDLGMGRELTTEQLDADSFTDFAGTIEMRSGRLHSPNNAPFSPSVRIVIRDNAQLYLHDGKTWANEIEVAGHGWQDNPVQPSAENAALRLVGVTLSGQLTIAADTTITAYDNDVKLTGAVIATNGFAKIGSKVLTIERLDLASVNGTVALDQGELRLGVGNLPKDTYKFGDTIQANAGTRLWVHVRGDKYENMDESNKVKIDSAITLNGGTLWFQDGNYVFTEPLTILSDSTLSAQYVSKGRIFKSLVGCEDVTLTIEQRNSSYAGPGTSWFLGGDFKGTISDVTSYGDPISHRLGLSGDALANATVDFSGRHGEVWLWDSASVGCLTNTMLLGGVNGNHDPWTLTLNGGYLAGIIADDCNEAKNGQPGLNANRAIGLSLGGTVGLGAIVNEFSGTLTLRDGLVLVPTVADSKFVAQSVAMDPAAKVTIDMSGYDRHNGDLTLVDWSTQGVPSGVTRDNFIVLGRYRAIVTNEGLFLQRKKGFMVLIK